MVVGMGFLGVEGFVVQVQYGGVVGGQFFEYFVFCFDDFFWFVEFVDMGGFGIGDDCYVWVGQFNCVGDFVDV